MPVNPDEHPGQRNAIMFLLSLVPRRHWPRIVAAAQDPDGTRTSLEETMSRSHLELAEIVAEATLEVEPDDQVTLTRALMDPDAPSVADVVRLDGRGTDPSPHGGEWRGSDAEHPA